MSSFEFGKRSQEIAGWQMVASKLRSEDLPALAADALVRGLDSPSLRELARQNPADVGDSADLFRLALTELGISLLDIDDALWSLVRDTAAGIVDGSISAAAGANRIWVLAYHRVEDSGDLRIFVGVASMLDDYPEDLVVIEAQIEEAARQLLQRPHPRRWMKVMATVGRSPLCRTVADCNVEVDAADLPIRPQLVADIEAWAGMPRNSSSASVARDHVSILGKSPTTGGFDSEQQAQEFVARGEQLVSRLQAELGGGYHVEYMPEPVRPSGVKLSRRR